MNKIIDNIKNVKSQVMKNISDKPNMAAFILDDEHKKRTYSFAYGTPFDVILLANDILKSCGHEIIAGAFPTVDNSIIAKVVNEMLPKNKLLIKHADNTTYAISNLDEFNDYFKNHQYDLIPAITGYVYHSISPFFSLIWNRQN